MEKFCLFKFHFKYSAHNKNVHVPNVWTTLSESLYKFHHDMVLSSFKAVNV